MLTNLRRLTIAITCLAGCLLVAAPASSAPPERRLALPEQPYRYTNVQLPANFEPQWVQALSNTPDENPTTDAGAALGRVLFYDTRMSASHTVSCGSCHIQKYAFAEPRRVSTGHEGRRGDRNAMSLVNLRFTRAGFFWDERADTLERAVQMPIQSRIEMAGPHGVVATQAIAADRRYAPLFKEAFGSSQVTDERIYKALAQFLRAMISCDSKYDRAAAEEHSVKEDFAGLTAAENRGKALFLQHCNLCHHIGEGNHVAFFNMFRSLGNGIDDVGAADGGRGDITLNPTEVSLFKASSLRNVEVTGPYMHDGRFATLEEVVEHYSAGVRRHPNMGRVPRLNLATDEKAALVAFLKTLTDESFLSDPRFSDPWNDTANQASPETLATVDAAGKLSSAEERLAAGVGIHSAEVLPWLLSLDKNKDESLDPSELEPLVAVLETTRVIGLSTERRRGGGRRAADERSAPPSAEGDFDGDGAVNEIEARAYRSLKRLVDLDDGLDIRRSVRTDRFLQAFQLTLDQSVAARRVLNAERVALANQMRALDAKLLKELKKVAGAEAVAQFETLVIDEQVQGVQRPGDRGDTSFRSIAERQVAGFDADGDDSLARDEIESLAAALRRLPGGFGQAAPSAIGMSQFVERFDSFDPQGKGTVAVAKLPERLRDLATHGDVNGDGALSREELAAYIRTTAFGHLMAQGIYVGGGFANTLAHHAHVIPELKLPSEKQQAAMQLLADHEQRLVQLRSAAAEKLFAGFREAIGNKVPVAAGG